MQRQRVVGLSQDPDEIRFRERAEFDADGQSALEFGLKIRWFGHVERARRDEEDVVCLHRSMLG